MNNIEKSYRTDTTFRTIVDSMRALLSQYHLTPSELREASILASALHEAENIRPLLIQSEGKGCMIPLSREYNASYMHDLYNNLYAPPAMFGGVQTVDTTTGSVVGPHAHVFENTPYGFKRCACGISDVYYEWSTSTPSQYIIEVSYGDGFFTRSENDAITKEGNLKYITFPDLRSAVEEVKAQEKNMDIDFRYRATLEKK